MHKKIESELVSIAHSILQMKNKEDVFVLQEKAKEVYEKLSVLTFVDRYMETTHGSDQMKEEILTKMEGVLVVEPVKESVLTEEIVAKTTKEKTSKNTDPIENDAVVIETPEEVTEQSKEEIEEVKEEIEEVKEEIKEEIEEVEMPDLFSAEEANGEVLTLEETLKDVVDIDVVADLLEEKPSEDSPKTSLNEALVSSNMQIGLNDRIAFVKHLFEGSQEDFNRVVSQVNSFKHKKEAVKFISKIVKPDYDWKGKEEFEERFMDLIERKFS